MRLLLGVSFISVVLIIIGLINCCKKSVFLCRSNPKSKQIFDAEKKYFDEKESVKNNKTVFNIKNFSDFGNCQSTKIEMQAELPCIIPKVTRKKLP